MHDATVEEQDHPWLSRVAAMLASNDNDDQRHCRALEYFYRAWPLDPRQRFPLLFMALDSILGTPALQLKKSSKG
jgi:hypothetical protein